VRLGRHRHRRVPHGCHPAALRPACRRRRSRRGGHRGVFEGLGGRGPGHVRAHGAALVQAGERTGACVSHCMLPPPLLPLPVSRRKGGGGVGGGGACALSVAGAASATAQPLYLPPPSPALSATCADGGVLEIEGRGGGQWQRGGRQGRWRLRAVHPRRCGQRGEERAGVAATQLKAMTRTNPPPHLPQLRAEPPHASGNIPPRLPRAHAHAKQNRASLLRITPPWRPSVRGRAGQGGGVLGGRRGGLDNPLRRNDAA
jgi:hypothetical protein